MSTAATPIPVRLNSPAPLMPARKCRIAIYLPRPLDVEAYSLLIETTTHSRVVVRSTNAVPLAKQIAASGATFVVVDHHLIDECGIQALAELVATTGVCVAILAKADGNLEPLVDGVHMVCEPRQLTLHIENHANPEGLNSVGSGKLPAPSGPHLIAAGITRREREVWQLIAEGHSVRGVATKLGLAESTIDSHKSRLMKKLGVNRSLDLVLRAIRLGMIEP